MIRRDANGKFVRTRQVWTPERWNDGHLDSKGKFRVYRPDYPRVHNNGYAFRAHIVWWLKHDEHVPDGYVIHHKNGIKDDDRLENLELMEHGEHTILHHKKHGVDCVCEACGEPFPVPKWRVNQRIRERGSGPKYCSLRCYNNTPRAESHKRNISLGLRAYHGST